MTYTKPTRIQWFKNGDHPEDSVMRPFEDTGEKPTQPREGAVVRYFWQPDVDSNEICDICGYTMGRHGYLEKSINEHTTVCPGDCIEKVGSDRYRIVNEGNEGILLEKKIKTATQEHQTKKRQQETTHETYTYNDSDDILPMTSSKTQQHMALINAINNNMPDNIIENIMFDNQTNKENTLDVNKDNSMNTSSKVLDSTIQTLHTALQSAMCNDNFKILKDILDMLGTIGTEIDFCPAINKGCLEQIKMSLPYLAPGLVLRQALECAVTAPDEQQSLKILAMLMPWSTKDYRKIAMFKAIELGKYKHFRILFCEFPLPDDEIRALIYSLINKNFQESDVDFIKLLIPYAEPNRLLYVSLLEYATRHDKSTIAEDMIKKLKDIYWVLGCGRKV